MKEVDRDLDDETYEKIKKYMENEKIKSFDEAFNEIIGIALKHREKLKKMH